MLSIDNERVKEGTAIQQHYDSDQPAPPKGRSRLIIDIVPELRRRIRVAAAQNDLSIQEYVGRILDEVVPLEAMPEEREHGPIKREALDRLLKHREEFMRAHPGLVFEDSVETLRQIREERMEQLEQASRSRYDQGISDQIREERMEQLEQR